MEGFLVSLLERACVRAVERAATLLWRVLRERHSFPRRPSRWIYDAGARAYVWKVPKESGRRPSREP